MNGITNIFFIAALLFCTIKATAQNNRAFDIDTAIGGNFGKHIHQLLSDGTTDTVINFKLPINYSYDSIPNHNMLSNVDAEYILYKSGGNTFIKRYLDCWSCDYNFDPKISSAVHLINDTLFCWLQQHMKTIEQEDIATFAVKITLPVDTLYQSWGTFHAPWYWVNIVTRQKYIEKRINEDDLQQKYKRDDIINLNYEYNTSTKLYHLFQLLEDRCKKFPPLKFPS
jgi:hypothetical protein